MTSLHVFQKPTVQRQTLLKNGGGRHERAESFDPPKRTEDRALLRSSGGARSAVYPSQASGVITRPF